MSPDIQQLIDAFQSILAKERVIAAAVTSVVAFIGVFIGVLSTNWLEIRREKVRKKNLAGSFAGEIRATIDIINLFSAQKKSRFYPFNQIEIS